MNFLRKGLSLLTIGLRAQSCLQLQSKAVSTITPNFTAIRNEFKPTTTGLFSRAMSSSLMQMHKRGPPKRKQKKKRPLNGKPFAKGVVLKTLIKKPKKPNSANRKCVMVRLSTGREMVAYVPGIGHNLQEHNIVLVRVGRVKDCPGVKLKCVRGVYDLPKVVKQKL